MVSLSLSGVLGLRLTIYLWFSVIMSKFFLCVILVCSFAAVPPEGQRAQTRPAPKIVYIPLADAKPVIAALDEILPNELRGKSESALSVEWPQWVARHDAEIRSRLAQGDEDSLVNFLLFGTSFTRQSRLTLEQLREAKSVSPNSAEPDDPVWRLIAARAGDLVNAAAAPGANDRLLFGRKILVSGKGFRLETKDGRERAKQYLTASFRRVINENAGYARAIEAARLQGDATEEFAERSRLFRARGLSSDTSLLPNYALEESLKEIKQRRLFESGGVRRVAIIGPGLDFTDKQEGYDFYPQQTIQPFAIMDSLLRLGLARADDLQVITFDLSPRVNDHIAHARDRAQKGQGYVVQLPRDEQAQWKPEAVRYWQTFGDQIGKEVAPVAVPTNANQLRIRAVQIRSGIVTKLSALDTNIVLQRLELPASEKFELIIATNILVYYDNLDQTLAMINVERMLRPGGLMLSNNAVLDLPFFRVHSIGYSTVVYSDRPNDGDHIVWYRRSVD